MTAPFPRPALCRSVGAGLVLALAGCTPEPTPSADDVPPASRSPAPAGGAVPTEPLASLFNSGYEDSTRQVIRGDAEWAAAWERMHAGTSPQPSLPAVDFAGSLVLVAALGTRPSGGFAIAIDSVVRSGDALVAHVTSTAPGQSCGTTAALTQPVAAVRVGATAESVRWEERQVVREC